MNRIAATLFPPLPPFAGALVILATLCAAAATLHGIAP
jgi:hypothetical protein